jgi:hypothetical protein
VLTMITSIFAMPQINGFVCLAVRTFKEIYL